MLRTFQFRLYPNATQRSALELVLRDNAETYNAALQERRDAWKLERKAIPYRMQQDDLRNCDGMSGLPLLPATFNATRCAGSIAPSRLSFAA